MRVPNAEFAVIDLRKLVDYSLDPNHEVGQHKAVVFSRVLGLTQDDAGELIEALKKAVMENEAVAGKADVYGQRYVVDFEMSRFDRTAKIRSIWMVAAAGDPPRMITCFVI